MLKTLSRRLPLILIVIYVLINLYTVASAYLGWYYTPLFTPALTLLAFSFACVHGSQRLGWRRALLLLALTFAVSLLFESVGVATGLIYGKYHYTEKLGYRFLGLVPLLIPLAWFQMLYPAYVMAERIVQSFKGIKAWPAAGLIAALGGLGMVAWDLAMDPLMVAGEHWVWDQPGAYFGIPLQNYWGWWLTICVTLLLFAWLDRARAETPNTQTDYLAVSLYIAIGLGTVLVDLRAALVGPALVGLAAMGLYVVGYYVSLKGR